MATLIWIPDSLGSTQNTIQDMATIRISGRMTLTTKYSDFRSASKENENPGNAVSLPGISL